MNQQEIVFTLLDMIKRSEKILPKFKEGSTQHSLLTNRIHALRVAQDLVSDKLINASDLQIAKAPLESIVSKSSKALTKLKENSWQYKMLERNIEAVESALRLL